MATQPIRRNAQDRNPGPQPNQGDGRPGFWQDLYPVEQGSEANVNFIQFRCFREVRACLRKRNLI